MEITVTKETQELINESEKAIVVYKNFSVETNETNIAAAEALSLAKRKIKELEARRKKITDPLNEAKASAMSLFRRPIEAWTTVKNTIERAKRIFIANEQDKQRKEQARIDELARKEKEKQEKALEKRIANAAAKGKTEKVEELKEAKEEIQVMTPVVENKVEKIAGESMRDNWKFKITDKMIVPREYWKLDLEKIGKMVKASGGTFKALGIEIYNEPSIVTREQK